MFKDVLEVTKASKPAREKYKNHLPTVQKLFGGKVVVTKGEGLRSGQDVIWESRGRSFSFFVPIFNILFQPPIKMLLIVTFTFTATLMTNQKDFETIILIIGFQGYSLFSQRIMYYLCVSCLIFILLCIYKSIHLCPVFFLYFLSLWCFVRKVKVEHAAVSEKDQIVSLKREKGS